MGTLSESVCDNVWESKADTLCRPACAQTLVLVNPFSKVDMVLDERKTVWTWLLCLVIDHKH